MMLALGIALVIVAVAFALLPLFRKTPQAAAAGMDRLQRRAALYQEILDGELDYRLGKLSESDYVELRERKLAEAVVLIGPDESSGAASASSQIEAEIAAAREALHGRPAMNRAGA